MMPWEDPIRHSPSFTRSSKRFHMESFNTFKKEYTGVAVATALAKPQE
jgi:hypothetical protein